MAYSGVSKQRNIGFYIITDHFVLNVNVLRKNYGERSAMCLFCTLKVMEFFITYELKINLM